MPVFNPPRRYGMLQPPPAAVAVTNAPSFKNVGWLLGGPSETARPSNIGPGWIYNGTPNLTPQVPDQLRSYKVAPRQTWSYSDPPELLGVALWRRQAIVTKAPQQYGTDAYSLGHYQPFRLPRPTGPAPGSPPLLSEAQNSSFQPISRGGHVTVSITESNYEGGPGAAARRFANTRFGLWFKAWVVGGANIRPLGSVQTPSPQFRGVLPGLGYNTIPRIIGQ